MNHKQACRYDAVTIGIALVDRPTIIQFLFLEIINNLEQHTSKTNDSKSFNSVYNYILIFK